MKEEKEKSAFTIIEEAISQGMKDRDLKKLVGSGAFKNAVHRLYEEFEPLIRTSSVDHNDDAIKLLTYKSIFNQFTREFMSFRASHDQALVAIMHIAESYKERGFYVVDSLILCVVCNMLKRTSSVYQKIFFSKMLLILLQYADEQDETVQDFIKSHQKWLEMATSIEAGKKENLVKTLETVLPRDLCGIVIEFIGYPYPSLEPTPVKSKGKCGIM